VHVAQREPVVGRIDGAGQHVRVNGAQPATQSGQHSLVLDQGAPRIPEHAQGHPDVGVGGQRVRMALAEAVAVQRQHLLTQLQRTGQIAGVAQIDRMGQCTGHRVGMARPVLEPEPLQRAGRQGQRGFVVTVFALRHREVVSAADDAVGARAEQAAHPFHDLLLLDARP
jgi:hypothetical protein